MSKTKKKKEWVLQAQVISALRRVWRKSPFRQEALKKSKSEYYVKCKNGNKRRRVHYQCAICGEFFSDEDIQVDHIDPVVDMKTGFVDYNKYVERLFCPVDNLQVLCIKCHKAKTKQEAAIRRKEAKKRNPPPKKRKTTAKK